LSGTPFPGPNRLRIDPGGPGFGGPVLPGSPEHIGPILCDWFGEAGLRARGGRLPGWMRRLGSECGGAVSRFGSIPGIQNGI